MTKLSVKKPFLTIVAIVIILVIGFVSMDKMKTDLLPDISMPYMMIITTEPGASPEKIENDVVKPLESALGTISGVEKVVSNSAENYCLVMLEFSDHTNMDSAMVRVSSAINQVTLPEIWGVMVSIKAVSPGKSSFRTLMHSWNTGLPDASFMLFRKPSIFSP